MLPIRPFIAVVLVLLVSSCDRRDVAASTSSAPATPVSVAETPTPQRAAVAADTCSGTWPAYWQDPAPAFAGMWKGQEISNQPPAGWTGPVFRLSDRFPRAHQDEAGSEPWRDAKFDALFADDTPADRKAELANEYIWAVMHYIQAGNTDSDNVASDWVLCDNKVRNWFHIPFQTYDVLSGREFVHGLTREAPVTFSMAGTRAPLNSTMWAVAFYNPTAAYTLGTVWQSDGTAVPPSANVLFDEGAVIGKLLFNTLSAKELPFLANMPAWRANLSAPEFCSCQVPGKNQCSMVEQSQQCPRSTTRGNDGMVLLMQFDVAIKDHRAPRTGWVFGTFVADGERKAGEANPWNRISPLGLMWGNDTPVVGELAARNPAEPRKGGFKSEVIFWDTVDMLNAAGGAVLARRPGHLGCNRRLNGPADNASSSCMSCHMTASVPDVNWQTPPILAQFSAKPIPPLTYECVTPSPNDPTKGLDAGGNAAQVHDGISFPDIDQIYFADTAAGTPVNMAVANRAGMTNILGKGIPTYSDGHAGWIALDFSIQLEISLIQWGEWQLERSKPPGKSQVSMFKARLPAR